MAAENGDDGIPVPLPSMPHSLAEQLAVLHNPAGRENPFSTDYPSIPCSFSAAVKRIEFVPLHGNNFKIPEREMLKALSLPLSRFLLGRARGQLWLFLP